MKFMRLGGVLAGAMLLAPLATSTAQAAEITPASVSSSYVQSDDCYYSHWWDGSWHRRVRLVCDDNDNYYYGGNNYHRGRNFDRGGDHRGNFGNHNFTGGNRGTGGHTWTGGNTGGHGHR